MMIAISTYSGECDGLGYAAELAGITVAAYCESNPKRRAKLAEKHPGVPIFESDEELTADAIHTLGIHPDILFGGPPCQPFSNAGTRRGTADSRHRWPEMLRFIRECKPRWVVVENVGGFVNLALDIVWSDLEAEGYEVGPIVLPALAVGAPHRRDRCFVVAYADSGFGNSEDRKLRAGRHAVDGGGYVANSDSAGLQGRNGQVVPERACERFAGAGCTPSVADSESVRWNARRAASEGFERQSGVISSCIRGMGDANSRRCDRHNSGDETGTESTCRHPESFWRSIESRLGRGASRLSDRLDEVGRALDEQMSHWPAWRGEEQYPWEPPRTIQGLKERPRRIESLGLAVVPWQAYPIFALIKAIDDMAVEGGSIREML